MIKIKLAYGNDGVTLCVPDSIQVDRFSPMVAENPVTYKVFAQGFAAAGGDTVIADSAPLIIVNDGHRNTPTPHILKWLDQYDRTLIDRAHFLIAAGSHPPPSDDHLNKIFGPFLPRVTDRLSWHSAYDKTLVQEVGIDHFGIPVFVNKKVFKHKQVLIIGSVEPHYFAGFTGGRKAFFPGLTDMATIERNHNLANSLDAAPLKIDGNPMAEHLDEMVGLINHDGLFTIQVVLDAKGHISHACFGQLGKAFREGMAAATQMYTHMVNKPYELAIAEMLPPLDHSLYQAQKALENCQQAVADGGTVLVVSACKDGIGSQSFYDLAAEWDRETNQPKDGVTRFGSHKLSRVNAMTRRINVRLYSDLDTDVARRVFYEPVSDLNALVAEIMPARLAVIHDAGNTVLQTKNVS